MNPGPTAFTVLAAISFCHFLNDMMQALLPAMYPMLKQDFGLDFGQVGLITFTFQLAASLLQPVIGHYTDRRPQPYSLMTGMTFTLLGLILLSLAHSFHMVLLAAGMVGLGSAVFHPESSRVARMASGSTGWPSRSSRWAATRARPWVRWPRPSWCCLADSAAWPGSPWRRCSRS
jgi:FSR family fosmidomycin resistance protein-like MFS transporter